MLPHFSKTFEAFPIQAVAAARPVSTPQWGDVNFAATPNNTPPDFDQSDVNKRLYGIELAKNHQDTFAAALKVFPKDTKAALWCSFHWTTDPVVIAARDIYAENTRATASLLDKDQFAAKLLATAEEKNQKGGYLIEAKDRIACLKLYGEARGFLGKVDNSVSVNNFANNQMVVKFVEPDKKQEKVIEHIAKETQELKPFPLAIKLVG